MVCSRSVLCSVRHHCASAALFLSSNITFHSPDTKPSWHALNRFVSLLPMVIKPPVSLTNPSTTVTDVPCSYRPTLVLQFVALLLLILGVLTSLLQHIFLYTYFYPVSIFNLCLSNIEEDVQRCSFFFLFFSVLSFFSPVESDIKSLTVNRSCSYNKVLLKIFMPTIMSR